MSTAADRARIERAEQGLSTPAAPSGDPDHDARLAAAYHKTVVIISAAASSTPPSAARSAAGEPQQAGGVLDGAAGSTRVEVRYGEVTDAGSDERTQAAAPRQAPAKRQTRPVRADRVRVPDAG